MKEQFANVATFIRDHISFYFRPNPLLSVSKEAREHLFTREKLYEFDSALCNKKTLYEFNCGHKVTVKAFPTESHEHDMVEKVSAIYLSPLFACVSMRCAQSWLNEANIHLQGNGRNGQKADLGRGHTTNPILLLE